MLSSTRRCSARLNPAAGPSTPLLSSRLRSPTPAAHLRPASTSAPTSATLSPLNLAKAAFRQARAKPLLAADGRTPIRLEDPLLVLGHELGSLRANVQQLLGSKHPGLDKIAKYYFQQEGKHVRPMIVLLMAQATNGLAPGYAGLAHDQQTKPTYDDAMEPANVLNDHNPDILTKAKEFITNPLSSIASLASPSPTSAPATSPLPPSVLLLPTQRRLAEIIEMIHVASLLHDDVIDVADTRRSSPSAPALFGNKLSILAGDFLLARASLACARLGSVEVVELIASVLANLVEGEVMQMKGNSPGKLGARLTPEIMEHYITKSYMKTASLIAKSARATTILGGCGVKQGWAEGEQIKDAAYTYGKHLGIAFQVSTRHTYSTPTQSPQMPHYFPTPGCGHTQPC